MPKTYLIFIFHMKQQGVEIGFFKLMKWNGINPVANEIINKMLLGVKTEKKKKGILKAISFPDTPFYLL